MREFFTTGHLLPRFNATPISFIPKVTGEDKLNQFRHVSCCLTIYKVITRLLSTRLNLFIPQAVQNNQVGFIKGRFITENVLLASELVDGFHLDGNINRGCLQIDISKAYDNVNWEFLLNILSAMNLPPVFIHWIKVCISTPSFSVNFNGELVGFFQGKKGLRQGDPMSSYLFTLVMDILAKLLDREKVNGSFITHPKCQAPLITHLSFADDVLIFFYGAELSLQGILAIRDDFGKGSGLGMNREKSALHLDGGNFHLAGQLADTYGLSQGCLPFRYMCVPLMSQKMRKQDYQPLIEKISSRFSSWTVKHLSFAGRL